MTRRGPTAVHFLPAPLETGATVDMEVDWQRRFDHMQQHSSKYFSLIIHTHTTLTCNIEDTRRVPIGQCSSCNDTVARSGRRGEGKWNGGEGRGGIRMRKRNGKP